MKSSIGTKGTRAKKRISSKRSKKYIKGRKRMKKQVGQQKLHEAPWCLNMGLPRRYKRVKHGVFSTLRKNSEVFRKMFLYRRRRRHRRGASPNY